MITLKIPGDKTNQEAPRYAVLLQPSVISSHIWPMFFEYRGNLIILWIFHLGISCTVFVLIFTVVVLNCFVMCVCVCVCVCIYGWVMWCVGVWAEVFRAFSSVVRQMPGYNSQRLGTASTLPNLLFVFFVCYSCCVFVNCNWVDTRWQCTFGWHPVAVHIYT
jgi:hypothetical protein